MGYVLGVDVGTTFTAAAVVRDGRVEAAPLDGRRVAVPSVAYRDGDDLVVGIAAERRTAEDPSRVAREFKRRVGDPTPILLGGAPFAPELLMARLVDWVAGEVARTEGAPPDRLALAHPALWGDYKLDLLRQALDRVGRRADELVAEPVAAATFYATRRPLPAGTAVAVYDLGGGTFDAAVVRAGEVGFEIVGRPDGLERLGGIDFDHAVFTYVLSQLGIDPDELDPDDATVAAAIRRLRHDCVTAKEALSEETGVAIPVLVPGARPEVRLTRSELEDMIRPAITETVLALRRTIESADDLAGDVAAVLLVGGSSRIPLVGQMVTAELGLPIAIDARPKDAIPMGAALVAAHGLPPNVEPAPPGPPAPSGPPGGDAPVPPGTPGEAPAPGPTAPAAGTPRWRSLRTPVAVGATVALAAAGLAALAWPRNDDDQPSPAAGASAELAGADLTVGSLPWGEQTVLGHVTTLAFEAAGATVTAEPDIGEDPGNDGGSQINDRIGRGAGQAGREALESGSIDMYWDYLGDVWVNHHGNPEAMDDGQQQYEAITDADADAADGIAWLEPTAFDATRAIAVNDETAGRLGLRTISDLADALADDPDAKLCTTGSLLDDRRPDDVLGLYAEYGVDTTTHPTETTTGVEPLFTQVDDGSCTAGVVAATDGRIEALGLTVLEDDRNYFGPYNATLGVRADVLDEHPEIADVIAPVAAALDDETMRHLNARVDVEGEDPAYVAADWLRDQGLVTGNTDGDDRSGGDDRDGGDGGGAGSSEPPPAGFGDGIHTVGPDVEPDRYIATDLGESCDWARLSSVSDDLDDVIVSDIAHGQAIVDILEGDAGFRSDDCGRWEAYEPPDEPATTIEDGDWVVGEQVEAGTYRSDETAGSGERCYWELADDFTGDFDSVRAIDTLAPRTIELSAGERFSTQFCGTWTHE